MQLKKKFSKLVGWLLRGAAITAIPLLMPASVGMGQRFGWVGAVLVWMYIGRVMKQDEQIK
jgi:hypothetical protein